MHAPERDSARVAGEKSGVMVIVASPGIAGAGRPLDTEDTGTAERVELEVGATYERSRAGPS